MQATFFRNGFRHVRADYFANKSFNPNALRAPVNSGVAQCIAKHVRDRKFPAPPHHRTFVLRIDLHFH
jgi:hypothetical protein